MESISTITYLKFSIGGYFSTHFEVILNRKTVTYCADEYRFGSGDKHKNKIAIKDLELFIETLNKLKIIEWNDEYYEPVYDGTQWELKISYNNGMKKSIFGSNCYPGLHSSSMEMTPIFEELMNALVQLIHEPTFFSGSFLIDSGESN